MDGPEGQLERPVLRSQALIRDHWPGLDVNQFPFWVNDLASSGCTGLPFIRDCDKIHKL